MTHFLEDLNLIVVVNLAGSNAPPQFGAGITRKPSVFFAVDANSRHWFTTEGPNIDVDAVFDVDAIPTSYEARDHHPIDIDPDERQGYSLACLLMYSNAI
jgi:hypothetical protein